MEGKNEQNVYPLPFARTLKMKLPMQILMLLCTLIFLAFTVISIILPDDHSIEFFLVRVSVIFFTLYSFYSWLSVVILKKAELKLTEDYIEYTDGLVKKALKWEEIESVKITAQYRSPTFIGLIKKGEKSFFTRLLHGFDDVFALKIPLYLLEGIDREKLYQTISSRLSLQIEEDNVPAESHEMLAARHENDKKEERKPPVIPEMRMLLKFLLVAVFAGALCGISINTFGAGIVIFPFLGCSWMIYIYERGTKKAGAGRLTKFALGLFSAAQVVIAVIVSIMLRYGIPFNIGNILQVTIEYLRHLITNPLGQSRVFSLMALLFFWGYLSRNPSSPQGHREKANEEKRGGSR